MNPAMKNKLLVETVIELGIKILSPDSVLNDGNKKGAFSGFLGASMGFLCICRTRKK
jgi:hypothetical protein